MPATTNWLMPLLIIAATAIIPAATALIVTWLKAKTAALLVVRTAVQEVEDFSSARPDSQMSGDEKRELALRKIRRDPRTDISDQRATQLIDRVLPEVRRQSVPPPAPASPGPNLTESASGLPTPKRRP